MSRTVRGEKGGGYDYWGRRPLSGNCGYGKYVKKRTAKIERAQDKRACRKAKESLDNED